MDSQDYDGVIDAVRRIASMREQIADLEKRVREETADLIGGGFDGADWTGADGRRFRATVVSSRRMVVDTGRLIAASPEVYEEVRSAAVDTAALKRLIAEGRAPGWNRYAKYKPAAPSVRITETTEADA